jgi:hypothetical protein
MKKLLVGTLISFSMTSYAVVTIPYSFTGGTAISAAQMNQNFNAFKTFMDSLESSVSANASQISLANANIGVLQTAVDTLDSQVSGLPTLTTTVSTHSSMLATIDTDVDRILGGLQAAWGSTSANMSCPMGGTPSAWTTVDLTIEESRGSGFTYDPGTKTINFASNMVVNFSVEVPIDVPGTGNFLKVRINNVTTGTSYEVFNGVTNVKRFLNGDSIKLEVGCYNTTANSGMTLDSSRFVFVMKPTSF